MCLFICILFKCLHRHDLIQRGALISWVLDGSTWLSPFYRCGKEDKEWRRLPKVRELLVVKGPGSELKLSALSPLSWLAEPGYIRLMFSHLILRKGNWQKWYWKSFLCINVACRCQPVVVGANSMPAGIPNVECGEEGNCIRCKQPSCDTAWLWNSSIVLQLNYEAARLWGRMAVKRPWGEVTLGQGRPWASAPSG